MHPLVVPTVLTFWPATGSKAILGMSPCIGRLHHGAGNVDSTTHPLLAACWSSNNRNPAARPIPDGKFLAFEDQPILIPSNRPN